MRFQKGQEVVCIAVRWWIKKPVLSFWNVWKRKVTTHYGPKYNEVVTCDGYNDKGSMFLAEYRGKNEWGHTSAFNDDCFEPLISTDSLMEALTSQPETLSV